MKVGDGSSSVDVEGDETTCCKTMVKDDVERGRPESLILERLNPPRTLKGASGPRSPALIRWNGAIGREAPQRP